MEGNFWKGKNVFVTGASGFIGSWLTDELLKKGADVTVLIKDLDANSNLILLGNLQKVKRVDGRLEDYNLMCRILKDKKIDTVFHLAAQTQVVEANKNPLETLESNIRGTYNILEACRNSSSVKRIIVASSDKAYGTHDKLPYTEKEELKGRHPYDASKTCADILAQTYFNTYNLPVSIVRCGNIYGGGDLNFDRIVPGTIKSIIGNESPVLRSDGTFLRDYFYVKDTVNAYLTLAESMDKKKLYGEAFNFGSEKPISVLEITNKIISIMGSNLKPKIINTAKGEIKDQYLSCGKARKILNWKAQYSLEKGLKETIEWYKKLFERS